MSGERLKARWNRASDRRKASLIVVVILGVVGAFAYSNPSSTPKSGPTTSREVAPAVKKTITTTTICVPDAAKGSAHVGETTPTFAPLPKGLGDGSKPAPVSAETLPSGQPNIVGQAPIGSGLTEDGISVVVTKVEGPVLYRDTGPSHFLSSCGSWQAGVYYSAKNGNGVPVDFPMMNFVLISQKSEIFADQGFSNQPCDSGLVGPSPSNPTQRIQPGETVSGCVSFQVAANSSIKAVTYSGILNSDGQDYWTVDQ